MSTRGQVFIQDTGVYLYQHCDGYNLITVVANAIARGQRLDQPEYLTRIIFSEMLFQHYPDLLDSTGYGIGRTRHGDVSIVVTVNCKDQIVVDEQRDKVYTFEEFASKFSEDVDVKYEEENNIRNELATVDFSNWKKNSIIRKISRDLIEIAHELHDAGAELHFDIKHDEKKQKNINIK